MSQIVGVIGLGYVGLPLALALARKHPQAYGFDINSEKIGAIRAGTDPTREGLEDQLKATTLIVSDKISDLASVNFFIVGVPTPVDENNTPDLTPLKSACDLIGTVLKKGDIVVFESTVYPGLTEEFCGTILAKHSGLRCGDDFFLGYSPERMNPGDKEHTVDKIVKVISGQDSKTLDAVAAVYETVVTAGVFKAQSIRVAEAAKVIENTQRDLNIALMNELAIIFDRLGISTQDVLEAAGTKWNFLKFTPGLVGGHCIGVDPYYLTTKAQSVGYHPQVILAGRRINDGMGAFIAQKLVKLLIEQEIAPKGARVGVLGITFKENVSDVRNSRVPDIAKELKEFGVEVLIHDPNVSAEEAEHEYGIGVVGKAELKNLDALILAVAHEEFQVQPISLIVEHVKDKGVFIDVKSVFNKSIRQEPLPRAIRYWSL